MGAPIWIELALVGRELANDEVLDFLVLELLDEGLHDVVEDGVGFIEGKEAHIDD